MKSDFISELENLFNIKVEGQLKEILMFCEDMPVFFDKEKRLLSKVEILNYKEELQIEANVIPLIDCFDNFFLVYNIEKESFEDMDISTEVSYSTVESVDKYIQLLKKRE